MSISVKSDLERLIMRKVQSGQYSSADEVIRKGLELLQAMDEAASNPPTERAFSAWDALTTLASEVPDEDWAQVPADLSKNLDHYLYGTPRTAD